MEIFRKIAVNVLTALYQPFWFSILLSVFIMFFWMYVNRIQLDEPGYVGAAKKWLYFFRNDDKFRWKFLYVFFITMILFRTLINRNMWLNPLAEIMGNWWIYTVDVNGEIKFTTECIENVILFLPFSFLNLVCKYGFKSNYSSRRIILSSFKISFLFSISIEFLQLFLRLGSFQFSDITYNTLGGIIGSVVYLLVISLLRKRVVRDVSNNL